MAPVARTYGGIPEEQRRLDRRARLLETGLELLGGPASSPVTVRRICQEAKLNPRYFYESFSGLDDLLLEVFDQAMAATTAAVAAALAETDGAPEAAIRAGVGAFITATTTDDRVARVLFLVALGNAPLMQRRLDTAAQFAALAAAWADPPDPAVGEMVAGGLVQLILASLQGRLPGGRGALERHAQELTVALLLREA